MPDIVDTALNAGCFNTLVQAITTASLLEGLRTEGPLTVFAPSDEAFSKLPSGTVEKWLQNIPDLINILTYHIVPNEKIRAAELGSRDSLKTSEGSTLKVNRTGDSIKLNDANIVTPDVEADNGIIHIIDTVIIPQSVRIEQPVG